MEGSAVALTATMSHPVEFAVPRATSRHLSLQGTRRAPASREQYQDQPPVSLEVPHSLGGQS